MLALYVTENVFNRYFRTSYENVCCKTKKFEICEKIYKNMLALDRLTYGATELHPCQYCDRRFVFSSNLGQHSIGDDRDKFQFLCKICIKVYLSKLELIICGKNHPKAIYEQK